MVWRRHFGRHRCRYCDRQSLVLGTLWICLRSIPPNAAATEAHFVDEVNQWFTTHPILTCLHIVPGGLLVVLAPFQFSSHIRTRWIRFHRWSGRVIALAALPVGLSGLVL